jgi:hypothetical protein
MLGLLNVFYQKFYSIVLIRLWHVQRENPRYVKKWNDRNAVIPFL